jgi:hypothetical protein
LLQYQVIEHVLSFLPDNHAPVRSERWDQKAPAQADILASVKHECTDGNKLDSIALSVGHRRRKGLANVVDYRHPKTSKAAFQTQEVAALLSLQIFSGLLE